MERELARGLEEGDQAAVIRWRVAAEACVAMAMALAVASWFLATGGEQRPHARAGEGERDCECGSDDGWVMSRRGTHTVIGFGVWKWIRGYGDMRSANGECRF
jgi:hypothetical protein